MLQADFFKYNLKFSMPGKTSRGTLHEKRSWFLQVSDPERKIVSHGECSLIPGLSIDNSPDFPILLKNLVDEIRVNDFPNPNKFIDYPSIRFGLEMLIMDFENGGNKVLFPSPFTRGEETIPINGLIWMADKENTRAQVKAKLDEGYRVIKLKIGGLSFEDELDILKEIRKNFSAEDLEIRTDANGAFDPETALEKLKKLSGYQVHSIEQPIKAGQWEAMADLSEHSPVPVVLDEELIGIHDTRTRKKLIEAIQPAYIVVKPSLLGGIESSNEWIKIAGEEGTGYWVTSALESNIGLNALAQWAYTLNNAKIVHGLGTGQIYENNIHSPLILEADKLRFNPERHWDFSIFK